MTGNTPSERQVQEPAASAQRPVEPRRAASEMLELSREECLRLLASHSFGRLAVNSGEGPPVIRPVNYLFDKPSQSVVFRTATGSKFHTLLRSNDAAFEIDGVRGFTDRLERDRARRD